MGSLSLLAAEAATEVAHESLFSWKSWMVVLAYLIFTTVLGERMKGKQATIKDFFLGGRKLPWYAVAGSIVATELSAMTLVGVPAFLWADTGNMSYAILGIGAILSRILVGFLFVPKFYEEEIYSPYDYIGNRLGNYANTVTSYLFMLGGIMGQGVRVFLTAIVLGVVTDLPVHLCIWMVGAVAVAWTLIGGITSVIWTDLILFIIFSFSAVLTVRLVVSVFPSTDGKTSFETIWALGEAAGKTTWFEGRDKVLSISENYTIFTAFLSTIGGMAAYGTDQLMAQRCFCCAGPREARKALIWSAVGQIIMVLCLLMGLSLWAYYKHSGLPGVPYPEELAAINENPNRLLPVFIKYRVHWFFGGLMIAGIFAAAISSLDSILAALSQQTLAAIHRKKKVNTSEAGAADIYLSRVFIVVWAVALCGMASLFHVMASNATLLIELALAVVGYVQGGILGIFLLALIPSWRVKSPGIGISALFSVLTIVAITRHDWWAPILIVALLVSGILYVARIFPAGRLIKVLKLLPLALAIFLLNWWQFANPETGELKHIAFGWPWFVPLGLCMLLATAKSICDKQDPGGLAAGATGATA